MKTYEKFSAAAKDGSLIQVDEFRTIKHPKCIIMARIEGEYITFYLEDIPFDSCKNTSADYYEELRYIRKKYKRRKVSLHSEIEGIIEHTSINATMTELQLENLLAFVDRHKVELSSIFNYAPIKCSSVIIKEFTQVNIDVSNHTKEVEEI